MGNDAGGSLGRTPLIEFLIPMYNESASIVGTIESVLERIDANDLSVRVTVADNHSTDASVALLEAHFGDDPRVSWVVRERNVGARENFLQLLESATGTYVAFVGAHDFYSPTFAPAVLEGLADDSQPIFAWFAEELELHAEAQGPTPGPALRLHGSPRIRYWQLVLFLHRATLFQSLFPRSALDVEALRATPVFSLDLVYIHMGLRDHGLKRLDTATYTRLFPPRLGVDHASRNSAGELETRTARIEGSSGQSWDDSSLPQFITAQIPHECSRLEADLSEYLLRGKHRQGFVSHIVYRIVRKSFRLFAPRSWDPTR